MNFTPDQQRVIDTRGCNILVSVRLDELDLALVRNAKRGVQPNLVKIIADYKQAEGVNGEKKIEEAILRLYHFSMSYPFPEKWLTERMEDYRVGALHELSDHRNLKQKLLEICNIFLHLIAYRLDHLF